MVCNTGHYDCEINIPDLAAQAKSVREVRANNEEYMMKDGRSDLPAGQGKARQPRGGRRASLRSHGHVVRQPVPLPRPPCPRRQAAWRRRCTPSTGRRTGDRFGEARDHGEEDRHPYPGPGRLSQRTLRAERDAFPRCRTCGRYLPPANAVEPRAIARRSALAHTPHARTAAGISSAAKGSTLNTAPRSARSDTRFSGNTVPSR